MVDYSTLVDQVKRWVKEVGEIQLKGLSQTLSVNSKTSEFDLVTDIDQKSEQELINRILADYPTHVILAEETGITGENSEYLWIIDPLDGTVNYAHGYPVFCISIALQYCGEVILGVVYAPALNELFEAVKGEGAYLNGAKLRVAQVDELKKAILATGFPYDKDVDPDNNLNYVNHLIPMINGIRRTGAAAYDLSNVAAGRFNGYWEFKVNRWDIAAGTLLVREAGGKVVYLPSNKGIGLIAGNERICELVRNELVRVNPNLLGGNGFNLSGF